MKNALKLSAFLLWNFLSLKLFLHIRPISVIKISDTSKTKLENIRPVKTDHIPKWLKV